MAVDTLTFAVLTLIYLGVTMALGYLGYKRTKEAEDYMVAGRKIHPAILALSYGATFISTSAIVGFGGVAGQLGLGVLWLTVLNIGIGIFIAFVVFGKKTRALGQKLKAVTFPDLMGKAYNSAFMQYASALVIVVAMPLYTAAILIGGARFIEETLKVDYNIALLGFAIIVAVYVIIGGLLAVMYTDAMQGVIMLIGMTILLVFTYILLGGVTNAHAALTAMAPLVPQALAAAGHTGWTSMPAFGSPLWLTLITTIVLGVGIGVLAQPQLVVRFMTVKDSRSLNRAVFIGGPFILMMTGVAFTVGALTNVYFYQHQGMIALAVAGGNVDLIIPTYINAAMPDLFVVVFMLTLLAAAMSTLSSLFHTMGTAVGYDIWTHTRKRKPSLGASRYGIIVMIVISVLVAFVMPGSIIARATAMFMGLCASAFLPAFAMALYAKKPSTRAAKTSLVMGALTWLVWGAFIHKAISNDLMISKILFGGPIPLGMPWPMVDPLIIALPISIVVLVAVWLLERHMSLTRDKKDVEVA
ncbi:MAG TPA: sodium:solute symporter family protein [Methanomicrobiales archaeon]|nr:sodium:solute symporter family protein [Methanomicrobiales archaeon]